MYCDIVYREKLIHSCFDPRCCQIHSIWTHPVTSRHEKVPQPVTNRHENVPHDVTNRLKNAPHKGGGGYIITRRVPFPGGHTTDTGFFTFTQLIDEAII